MMDIIPETLRHAGQVDNLILWVRHLRIDKETRKQLLMLWCDRMGVTLTGEMVKKAGIE